MAMSPRTKVLLVIGLVGAALLVRAGHNARAAEPPRGRSLHDIPWYVAHPEERRVTLQLCRNDHALGRLPDCANAETAETRLWERRARQQSVTGGRSRSPNETLQDPTYWAQNRLTRAGALAQCRTGNLGLLTRADCLAAERGEATDRGLARGN